MDATPSNIVSMPLSIGVFGRQVVIDCVRKWARGAALDERERKIMDDALALNRFDMMQTLFADRECAHAQG